MVEPGEKLETTPPGEETEQISKAELARLREGVKKVHDIEGYTKRQTEKITGELEEARGKVASYELKELVQAIATEHEVDDKLLMKVASKMTKEELEDFAKDLPKVGERQSMPLKLDSGRSSGKPGKLTVEQIKAMSSGEIMERRKEIAELPLTL